MSASRGRDSRRTESGAPGRTGSTSFPYLPLFLKSVRCDPRLCLTCRSLSIGEEKKSTSPLFTDLRGWRRESGVEIVDARICTLQCLRRSAAIFSRLALREQSEEPRFTSLSTSPAAAMGFRGEREPRTEQLPRAQARTARAVFWPEIGRNSACPGVQIFAKLLYCASGRTLRVVLVEFCRMDFRSMQGSCDLPGITFDPFFQHAAAAKDHRFRLNKP